MSTSTDPIEAEKPQGGDAESQTSDRPHGYTLADEEYDRLVAKSASGDVLDPIALNDPVGQSVEKVILRVGIAVVVVLVAGILLAQVACKNLQRWGIPDFSTGVTVESVEAALSRGISWGGDIVHFPEGAKLAEAEADDSVCVEVTNDSARTFEQLVSSSQVQASALAMNLFRDPAVNIVSYVVSGPVSPETGTYATSGATEEAVLLTVVWQRDPNASDVFTCSITGYDPDANSAKAELASKTEKL